MLDSLFCSFAGVTGLPTSGIPQPYLHPSTLQVTTLLTLLLNKKVQNQVILRVLLDLYPLFVNNEQEQHRSPIFHRGSFSPDLDRHLRQGQIPLLYLHPLVQWQLRLCQYHQYHQASSTHERCHLHKFWKIELGFMMY
jgi:hypothetical protein